MITKDEILDNLQNDLSEPNLQIFKNSVDIGFENDELSLIVNDNYMKQWLENKCFSLISSYFDCHIKIQVNITEEDDSKEDQLELFKEDVTIQPSKFNTMFTFDRFIVGNNNRFAYLPIISGNGFPSNR